MDKFEWTEDSLIGMDQLSGIVRKNTPIGGTVLRKERRADPEKIKAMAVAILKSQLTTSHVDKAADEIAIKAMTNNPGEEIEEEVFDTP